MRWAATSPRATSSKVRPSRSRPQQGLVKLRTTTLNQNGEPWTRKMLSQNFRRAKAKLKDPLDDDACMYSCRHTYAKRVLEGFWTGRPASINSLARLMGNTVKVCIDHYLLFSEADNEMLWGAA